MAPSNLLLTKSQGNPWICGWQNRTHNMKQPHAANCQFITLHWITGSAETDGQIMKQDKPPEDTVRSCAVQSEAQWCSLALAANFCMLICSSIIKKKLMLNFKCSCQIKYLFMNHSGRSCKRESEGNEIGIHPLGNINDVAPLSFKSSRRSIGAEN